MDDVSVSPKSIKRKACLETDFGKVSFSIFFFFQLREDFSHVSINS